MIAFFTQRIVTGFVTLFVVSVIVFLMVRVLPGDAALVMTGGDSTVSEQDLETIREQLGLNRSLIVQYAAWAKDAVVCDFGESLRTGNQVMTDIGRRLPYTAQIIILAMVIAVAVGIPTGVLCARYVGSWADRTLQSMSIFGLAAPSFWIGLLLILALVVFFQWSAPLFWEPFWVSPLQSTSQLIWPAIAVGLRQTALIVRMTRSIMLDVLNEDYIRTARAKGLAERIVVFRHGLRNALLPVVTLIGFEFSALFGGLIVTETVFSVPGVGQYVVASILNRDYPAAQGVVLVLASIVVIGNLAIDLLYGVLDPRTRVRKAAA